MSFSATPTQACAVIANYGISKDARARIRKQQSGLLQQPAVYGVSDELLQKLQVIQNAAARVVTGARKLCKMFLTRTSLSL